MKNLKITLISVAILICIPLSGAQAPLKAPQKEAKPSMAQLPPDLRNELLLYSQYGSGEVLNLPALANTITAMGSLISPEKLLSIFESLPTYAAALNLAELLKDSSVINSKPIQEWLLAAKAKLANGQNLYEAGLRNNLERFTELAREKNIDLDWKDKNGKTPLMLAALRDDLKSVRILIAAGANVNAKDKLGGTALIRGCGRPEIIKFLIGVGAQVNEQDIYGDTILMRVSRQGDIESVRLLLAVGAEPAIQNEDRKSASDLAREYGKYAIAKLLDEAIAERKAKQLERQ